MSEKGKIGQVDFGVNPFAPVMDVVEQPGYKGKHWWLVEFQGQKCKVRAEDEISAGYFAAKFWGYQWKRVAFREALKITRCWGAERQGW